VHPGRRVTCRDHHSDGREQKSTCRTRSKRGRPVAGRGRRQTSGAGAEVRPRVRAFADYRAVEQRPSGITERHAPRPSCATREPMTSRSARSPGSSNMSAGTATLTPTCVGTPVARAAATSRSNAEVTCGATIVSSAAAICSVLSPPEMRSSTAPRTSSWLLGRAFAMSPATVHGFQRRREAQAMPCRSACRGLSETGRRGRGRSPCTFGVLTVTHRPGRHAFGVRRYRQMRCRARISRAITRSG
jgi:hypothetical protein